uniref:Sidekick cell adhesion molecule 2b n=1 Tax=Oryzias sinensis TaxID=183150 RepID=A0A8C7ZCR3_9TELE
KTEPVRSQLHLERNRLVLTCMAEGSWPLEFKWIHNNTELTRFSLEYRYLIPSLDRSHAGFYRCIVRNRVGALLQRRTEVQVAFMGSFEEGERNQSVSQGEGAVVPAPRIRSFPQPQVTWYKDGHKIPPTSRIAITLDNTLVILSTVAPDAGRYYVQAVNDKNGENKTSQPITLSVESPADPIAPTIIISPRNTSVVTGTSEVTMECVANARPLIKLSISWRKNGVLVSSGLSDYNRRLTILSPVVSDAGYYECEAVLRSSSVPSVSAGAYLHVLEPPQFIKEPDKHITAEMEKVVDIPCQARGVPQPDIVWYKDALPIDPVKTPRYRVLVGGSLQVNGLLPDDTGMFQCFARNMAGEVQTNTYLAVTSIAPNITAGPSDSTVIDGMSVILHCETSGAPRPAITWQKGERVLASGSVQLPRFTLLESGSLLISPSHISDAGTYTCMASNSRGIDEASADLIVWARTRITTPPQDLSVIKGTKAVMTCGVTHDPSVIIRHFWEKDGSVINVQSVPRMQLSADGTLHISQTWSGDIGTYTCRVTSVGGNDSRSAHLRVRQLPHAPENPTAVLSKSEKRAIDLAWAKSFDGNSPLIRYILEVSENNAPWAILQANIEPESTAVTVNGLIPARSYQFRLCAVNDVGKGQFSKETERVSLPEEPPSASPQNVITSGRTNQSIMIQWQPPQESHQNGILRGYIVRYRLTGLPVDYQIKNISSPDVTTLLLEDLIIWTNYEIEVAAYNGAGLGVFSHKVTEWTLQGVPTIAPGNVKAEAVNSTAIRFTWNAPNPQFINGINQGYKVSGWGEAAEALVVTTEKRARPQPTSRPLVPQKHVQPRQVLLSWEPGSDGLSPVRYYTVQLRELPDKNWTVHSASVNHEAASYIVSRLKPFTSYQFRIKATNDIGDSEYSEESEAITTLQDGKDSTKYRIFFVNSFASAAELSKHKRYEIRMSVYNTVGEGPTSPPQEVFVGEAAPPQNVAIQSATATQLDVTWDPPPVNAQNGDIQGYKIYFWEFQRKNGTERLRTLFMPEAGVKLKNLTGYTNYMISVAAFNAAGDGPRSSPTRGRTQQAAPSAPSFIHFSELTTTSVNVSWGEPTFPNGIIEGYRLIYEPLTPVEGVSKTVTVDVKGSGPLWLKLRDLADGVTYHFRIRAKTFIYGPEVEANITTGPGEGTPGPPGEPFITRYSSALTIHWASGDPGRAPISRYVIEARPSDEGLWDILIKDIPKDATSHTFNMDILKQGVSYDFRVIGVNDYGYGSPSLPSPSISAQKVAPFYEEWWFLVVVALVGLIFILLLVFILIIRGQSKKYAKKTESGESTYVYILQPGYGTDLKSRHLNQIKINFFGSLLSRSPPRPSPGSLHYSDEDLSTKYNDLIPAESSSLTEKTSEKSDSQSEHGAPPPQHSTLYRPPSSLAPGSRAPIAGFSSFV